MAGDTGFPKWWDETGVLVVDVVGGVQRLRCSLPPQLNAKDRIEINRRTVDQLSRRRGPVAFPGNLAKIGRERWRARRPPDPRRRWISIDYWLRERLGQRQRQNLCAGLWSESVPFVAELRKDKQLRQDATEIMAAWIADARRRGFHHPDVEILQAYAAAILTLPGLLPKASYPTRAPRL